MITQLITALNTALVLPVEVKHGMAELIGNGPHVHNGQGNWAPVTTDVRGAWSYWRLNGNVRVDTADIGVACQGVRVTVPLRMVAYLHRKNCDDMPDVMLRAIATLRASKKQLQTATGVGLVLFGSIGFDTDPDEYEKAPNIPTDRVLVNIDLSVALEGAEQCLTLCQ